MREAHDGCGWASGVLARGANCALNAKHPTKPTTTKRRSHWLRRKRYVPRSFPIGGWRHEGSGGFVPVPASGDRDVSTSSLLPNRWQASLSTSQKSILAPKGGNSQPSSCVVCEEAEEMDKQPPLIGAPPSGRPETTPNGSGRLLAVSTGNYTRRLTEHGAMNATSR
jgi:hypothetical protein